MRKTLLLLDLEDGYFLSHRRALALAAREAGYRVVVCARIGGARAERIRAEGFECRVLGENREGVSPWAEFQALVKLVRLYRKHRPRIAHHIGVRNLPLGSLAAWLARTPVVVNSFTGLGSLFAPGSLKMTALKKIVLLLLKAFHRRKNTHAIVQNEDDGAMLLKSALPDESRLALVRGSGVDVQFFRPAPEPPGAPLALLASRMLADKGVREFVEAARLLKAEGAEVRMALAGAPDPKNPSSIPESALAGWRESGEVEWWGYREDVREAWRSCHVAVLPSYREGLPRGLLEAAACGRPIVATDVPGCREIVKDGVNGLLVPPRDAKSLADAIRTLARNAKLRREMGAAGRRIVEEEFSDDIVVRSILALYERASGAEAPSGEPRKAGDGA